MLVVTAGCGGVGSQPPTDATTTDDAPSEKRTSEAAMETTGGAGDAEYPSGLSADGVESPRDLVTDHRETLGSRSLTLESAFFERYENGTIATRTSRTVQTAANRTRYLVSVNASAPNWVTGQDGEGELWANGTHAFQTGRANETGYDVLTDANGEPASPVEHTMGDWTWDEELLVAFTAFENATVQRLDDDPGAQRYRVTAIELAYPDMLGPDDVAVRNARLTAVIETDEDLETYVSNYRLRYEITEDNESRLVRKRARFSKVGETTVATPDWYAAANQTANES